MIFVAYVALAALALAICHYGDRLGGRLGVIDTPDGRRKIHTRATPLVGGIAVVLPTSLAALWLAATTEFEPLFGTLAASALAFMVLGLADDRQHVSPVWRLAVSLAIGVGAMTAVPALRVEFVRFSFIHRSFPLDAWSGYFSLLCLLGLVNAVNMADGKNGLAPGLALIWTGLIALDAPTHLTPLLGVLAASLAIVLAYNLAGRVFLGDSGSYALGALFGFLAIHVHDIHVDGLPSDRIALWFLIPVVDCLRLIGTRIMMGRSPFGSDRNHLHHILYAAMPWRYGLAVYLALAALPALAAWFDPDRSLLWAMIALTIYAGLLILLPRLGVAARGPSRA